MQGKCWGHPQSKKMHIQLICQNGPILHRKLQITAQTARVLLLQIVFAYKSGPLPVIEER